jgi:hypothetical protein
VAQWRFVATARGVLWNGASDQFVEIKGRNTLGCHRGAADMQAALVRTGSVGRGRLLVSYDGPDYERMVPSKRLAHPRVKVQRQVVA